LTGNSIHPRPNHLPPISQQQLQALDDLENAARQVPLEIKTRFGDIHFVNNLFILHRRESFLDDIQTGAKRHLLRMRLRDDTLGWELPISLQEEWNHAFDPKSTKIWRIDPMPDGFFPLRAYPN
jgi:hypothetical protein